MAVFTHREFDQHEQVFFCNDHKVGLQAVIAVHSTALGPAAGGCRMHPYDSADEALTDVLRLSRGMSYKNAVAGLPLGGGKSVIIASPDAPNKADLLRSFSRQVQLLGGRYWTAIDVGVGPRDADVMAENCDFIFARAQQYEEGFNPSSFTALGGFVGIKAVVEHLTGSEDLSGVRVAIQGLGATGSALAGHLHAAGARLIVADLRANAARDAVARYGAVAVDAEDIHAQDVDVFAPCALGGVINDETLPRIRAGAVCGLANNQLAEARHGAALHEKGIAYVPDYVVNAGGMMGASTVIFTTPSRETSIARIKGLKHTISSILNTARDLGVPSSQVADHLARSRMNAQQLS